MKKSVLILNSSFRWGGINRSLQSWLTAISPEDYDVDIFVMVDSGVFTGAIPNCTVLERDLMMDALLDQVVLKHGLLKIISIASKIINKISRGRYQKWLYGHVGQRLTSRKKYDAVIGWHEGAPTKFLSAIEHPNKISWIHCDYSDYTDGNTEREIYERIEKVVCVSKFTRLSFLKHFPDMESKTFAIYNILDTEDIKSKALQPIETGYDHEHFNIVSVGRISQVKRFYEIPSIVRKIVDAGYDIRWHIVGPYCPGGDLDKLMNAIHEQEVEDYVILKGEQVNPYPFIAAADLHVCTSSSESWSYVINEAKVLGIPSVSTDWGAAVESIADGKEGFISPIEEIPDAIIKMLDPSVYSKIRNNVSDFKYPNSPTLHQIDQLLRPLPLKEVICVSDGDSSMISTWSGIPYFHTKGLEDRGIIVHRVDIELSGRVQRLYLRTCRRFLRIFKRHTSIDGYRSRLYSAYVSAKVRKAEKKYPGSDAVIAYTFMPFKSSKKLRVIRLCDWTYQYFIEKRLCRQPDIFERRAIERENRAIEESDISFSLFDNCRDYIIEKTACTRVRCIGRNVINTVFEPDAGTVLPNKETFRSIVFIGRSHYAEGLDHLLKSFGKVRMKFPDIRLDIIGMEDWNVPADIKDAVFFHGYLHKEVKEECEKFYSILGSASLIVNPTPLWSGYTSMVEAMFWYTPVVVSPFESFVNEFGQDINFGKYCSSDDVAEKIIQVLDNQNFREMCLAAHDAVSSYTWDSYINDFLKIIQ